MSVAWWWIGHPWPHSWLVSSEEWKLRDSHGHSHGWWAPQFMAMPSMISPVVLRCGPSASGFPLEMSAKPWCLLCKLSILNIVELITCTSEFKRMIESPLPVVIRTWTTTSEVFGVAHAVYVWWLHSSLHELSQLVAGNKYLCFEPLSQLHDILGLSLAYC